MLDKEACCLVSQAIYEDLVLSFRNQGLLRSQFGPRVNQSHQVFFICRFPSELCTLQNHKDLFVISEDDLEPIHTALAGAQYISVVLFQVQTHIQEKILQLYRDAPKLFFVCLFHECFVNVVCFDLITAVCTTLRRHLGRVHCISKYQDFAYVPYGQTKKVTKGIYFILLHSSLTTNSLEVTSPNLEYAETWLSNSTVLTPKIQERIKSMSGVVRFRVHRTGVPVQTTLGVTDRCCITFCISIAKIHEFAEPLEQIYQCLRNEVCHLEKQELQRILPLIWISGKNRLPGFFAHQIFTLLDFRMYAKQPDTRIQNIIQGILLSMDIPYHFQKRSILILYASGTLLESFRQALFYEDIVLPFGKEEGCLQCKVDSNAQLDSWQVELQIVGSTKYEAYQIEDDGTLLDNKGEVTPELVQFLLQKYDASNIRTAIVHMQGKGQQKIVAFLANSDIQQQIPCAIKDHQGVDRVLQYKLPDVFTDPQVSNVRVKEMRADHRIISQAKGINQHARISAFLPFPRNELSRRRFSRVRSINARVNDNDVLCTILDEAVPVCLVNHELALHEVSCLLELLIHKQPILNHHSVFLSCSLRCPDKLSHEEGIQENILSLPDFSCIVHCHLNYNQTLTIHQPRFENGQVSRCISNSLQLIVYERTDIIFLLTGQFAILDLCETVPEGRILAIWKVPDNSALVHSPSSPVDPSAWRNPVAKECKQSREKIKLSDKVQGAEPRYPNGDHKDQKVIKVATNLQSAKSPATGKQEGESKVKTNPLLSSSEIHNSLQGARSAKRMYASFGALVKKVPVPKLPGAYDTPKKLVEYADKNEEQGHQSTGKPKVQSQQAPQAQQLQEQRKEQRKEPAVGLSIESNYQDLLSRSDGRPVAGLAKPVFASPTVCSARDNFPEELVGQVAPTQIDIELESEANCTGGEEVEEVVKSSSGIHEIVRYGKGKSISSTRETNLGAQFSPESVCEQASQNAPFVQPALQDADDATVLTPATPFSPLWVKEVCHYSDQLPADFEQSIASAPTTPAPCATQEINGSLDKSVIEEIDMFEPTEASKIEKIQQAIAAQEAAQATDETTQKDLATCELRKSSDLVTTTTSHCRIPTLPDLEEQHIDRKSGIALSEDPDVSIFGNLTSSIAKRRILTHMHTLKQLVASKTSLINMEFGEEELVQAAKLYDNLNATACFYTTALRLLSKADWQEPVDFEDHIVHQAMIAVANGWTTAIGIKTLPFDKYYLALAMATLPLVVHGDLWQRKDPFQ